MSQNAFAGFLLAAGISCASAGPCYQGSERQPQPADMVNLNVVAFDSHGEAAADLRSEDFQILDNGKPQHIASFRRNESKLQQIAPLGPHEYSNRTGSSVPHATLILFDLLNARFEDRGYAANELIRSLERIKSSDYLYLYLLTLSGSLYPVRPLPNAETDPLPPTTQWTQQIQQILNQALIRVLRVRPSEFDVFDRIRLTYDALGTLAAGLAAIPGRKNIVWISHGVPISLSTAVTGVENFDFTPQVRSMSAAFDRADVAIYPVRQPTTLAPDATQGNGGGGGRRGSGGAGQTDTASGTGLASEDTLEEFAHLTGGRAYLSQDIRGAVTHAMGDAGMSYLIAYDPPPRNWDGKYHKIRVTCSRKGIRILTKQGYYAFQNLAIAGDRQQASVDAAVSSPFDATEIGIRATLSPSESAPHAVHIGMAVDAPDIRLTEQGGQYSGQLSIAFAEYLADGRTSVSLPIPLALHLDAGQREKAMKEGILIYRNLPVGDGIEKVKMIVFDNGSHAIGSLTAPISKADLSAQH